MGRKRIAGLYKRGGVWHIDKQVRGIRICESSGESDLAKAEEYLARRIDQIRQAAVYGIRPQRTFRQAATKYLNETVKRSLESDAQGLQQVDPYVGHLPLDQVHMGTLQPYLTICRQQGLRSGTVNRRLAIVRRILNLAARLWRDEHGLTWLETPPLIQLQDWGDQRTPYPLSWLEQQLLFKNLPPHLARMALFKVHTGTREQEVCALSWEWEESFPALETSLFVIPAQRSKNNEERLVLLNSAARSVIEEQRGKHPCWVFPYRGRRIERINNTAWRQARSKAAAAYRDAIGSDCPDGFRCIRVHDLKHTFGRRLRAAGVSMETRKALLGHTSGSITTHYSAPEIQELLDAVEQVVVNRQSNGLVLIQGAARSAQVRSRKSPAVDMAIPSRKR